MPGLTILVTNSLADRHMKLIKTAMPNSTVISCDLANAAEHMANTDILLTWGSMDIRPLYLMAPKLKWIHALSAGVETLVFPEMKTNNTLLTNSRGIHGIPVSEHVFAMMLAFTRGLTIFIRQQDKKIWKRSPVEEIHDKPLVSSVLAALAVRLQKSQR